MKFNATNSRREKLKWFIYIILGICALIYIIRYSEWHFLVKFMITFPLIINLFFDILYLKKTKPNITNIELTESVLVLNRGNNRSENYKLSNLEHVIRKQKYDINKTEIELKEKKGLRFKTFERLHIKNWNELLEIEQELENHKISRVEWRPKTLWGKYWGIFIDIFFMTVTTRNGDIGMNDYHEKIKKERTKNNNA